MQKKSSTPQAAVQPVSSAAPVLAPVPRVSPLRERMLALMAERGFAEATRDAYVRGVLGLVARCGGRGPEAVTVDEARAYVAWLKSSGASATARSNASAGLRFLYESVLGRTWKPVTTLRRRMAEDLEMRGFAAKTRASYLRSVSPGTLKPATHGLFKTSHFSCVIDTMIPGQLSTSVLAVARSLSL